MRGLEITSIFKSMWEDNLIVAAQNSAGDERHLFSVSMDGTQALRMIVERKGGEPKFVSSHIPNDGFNIETHRYGYGAEHDNTSGLYAMRQYRKVRDDVLAYITEQKQEAALSR